MKQLLRQNYQQKQQRQQEEQIRQGNKNISVHTSRGSTTTSTNKTHLLGLHEKQMVLLTKSFFHYFIIIPNILFTYLHYNEQRTN